MNAKNRGTIGIAGGGRSRPGDHNEQFHSYSNLTPRELPILHGRHFHSSIVSGSSAVLGCSITGAAGQSSRSRRPPKQLRQAPGRIRPDFAAHVPGVGHASFWVGAWVGVPLSRIRHEDGVVRLGERALSASGTEVTAVPIPMKEWLRALIALMYSGPDDSFRKKQS